MKINVTLAGMLVASAQALTMGAQAAPVPATGGWIEVHGQNCKVGGLPGPCTTATDQVPFQVWDTVGTLTMLAGGSVNANQLKASLDGTALGGRITASFVDVYTLNGPAGAPLSFTANLSVTGTRSSGANTAVGFGLPGRGTFHSGSLLQYTKPSDPTVVDEVLTLALNDIDVGSTFSFSTIIDLLVGTGEKADFGSTAVLGFSLPDGYFVTSQYGFNGPGGVQPPVSAVPLPGSLALAAGGLLGVAWTRRRRFAGT